MGEQTLSVLQRRSLPLLQADAVLSLHYRD